MRLLWVEEGRGGEEGGGGGGEETLGKLVCLSATASYYPVHVAELLAAQCGASD